MRRTNLLELLLALVLLTTFVGCSVYMVMLGATAYQNMVEETKVVDNERIAFSFVENQLKMSENYKDISTKNIEGVECIVINNDESTHLIYTNDGFMYELITKKDGKVFLEGGEKIVECDSLTLDIDEHRFKISVKIDDEVKTKNLILR